MWNKIAGNLVAALLQALILMTPAIRDGLKAALKELAAQAESTPNKWDDIGIATLRTILGMDGE